MVDEHLPVLIGAQRQLSVATIDVKDTHTNLKEPLALADAGLGRAQEIFALGDPLNLEAQIRACGSLSLPPTAMSATSRVER